MKKSKERTARTREAAEARKGLHAKYYKEWKEQPVLRRHTKYNRAFRPLVREMLLMVGYTQEELRKMGLETLLKQKEVEGLIKRKIETAIESSYGTAPSTEASRTQ